MEDGLINALWIYLAAVNILLYALMFADKLKAVKHRRRLSEKLLFFFAVIGGAFGGTLAMYSCRHKTKHWYFAVFFPLLAVAHMLLVVYILH